MNATRTKTEITATAIYKVTTRDGKQCYAVPSDTQAGVFYMTCWNAETSNWTCTCKAGEFASQRGQSATCKHARAAQASIVANKAEQARRREEERLMDELAQEMREAEQAPQRLSREEYCKEFAIY